MKSLRIWSLTAFLLLTGLQAKLYASLVAKTDAPQSLSSLSPEKEAFDIQAEQILCTKARHRHSLVKVLQQDLLRRYPEAKGLVGYRSQHAWSFRFWLAGQLHFASYDAKGRWLGTFQVLRETQVPSGVKRVMQQLDLEPSMMVRIERAEGRPVYALFSEDMDMIQHIRLRDPKNQLMPHVFGGVYLTSPELSGKFFVVEADLGRMPKTQLSFVGLLLSADGNPVRKKDRSLLFKHNLINYPQGFHDAPWEPGMFWLSRRNWYPFELQHISQAPKVALTQQNRLDPAEMARLLQESFQIFVGLII